ncbi:MAG: F0F1 ATP synthase subunit delta [Candidatus Omnitrophica bacterium]|nr:F0F1 ATP synthase subunit delta [Candidatus Omnitrophota bacterium]MDD5477080.1 F0F1 ATP synthase subunit delta [Candidatus Omnitrophota bacterium]
MLIVSLILFQLLIFGGLIFLLRRVLTKNVTDATKHLEELSHDYSQKEQKLNQQLEEAKEKSQNIIRDAQQEAERLRTQNIKDLESQRDLILNQARSQSDTIIQQADKSRQALISELETRIEKEAINKACELMQVTLPEKFRQEVHLYWVKELLEDGFSQLKHLQFPSDISEVKITSAFSLTDEQRKSLSRKINDVLGYDAQLKEETESRVVAGLIISIGSLVLDGSLKNKIEEQAKVAK